SGRRSRSVMVTGPALSVASTTNALIGVACEPAYTSVTARGSSALTYAGVVYDAMISKHVSPHRARLRLSPLCAVVARIGAANAERRAASEPRDGPSGAGARRRE